MTQRHAKSVNRLLSRYGGDVALSRSVTIPPENSWDDPIVETVTALARLVQTGASDAMMIGGAVGANDLVGVMQVTTELGAPKPGDFLEAGGVVYAIITAEPLASDASAPVAWSVVARR